MRFLQSYNKSNAFTLVELMVVIGIVAMITAISVPIYKKYDTRTKVFKVYSIASGLADYMLKSYVADEVFPTTYAYGGVTRDINTWYNVNDEYVSWINVAVNTSDNVGKYVVAQLSPSVSLWQAMNGTTGGQNLFVWAWEEDGIVHTMCTDGNQSNSIPEEFLPTGCIVMPGNPVP